MYSSSCTPPQLMFTSFELVFACFRRPMTKNEPKTSEIVCCHTWNTPDLAQATRVRNFVPNGSNTRAKTDQISFFGRWWTLPRQRLETWSAAFLTPFSLIGESCLTSECLARNDQGYQCSGLRKYFRLNRDFPVSSSPRKGISARLKHEVPLTTSRYILDICVVRRPSRPHLLLHSLVI